VLDAEQQVFLVLLGDGRQVDWSAGQVAALLAAQQTSVLNRTLEEVGTFLVHQQSDQSIVYVDVLAYVNHLDKYKHKKTFVAFSSQIERQHSVAMLFISLSSYRQHENKELSYRRDSALLQLLSHSRSPISAPSESPYAIFCQRIMLTYVLSAPFSSYRTILVKLSLLIERVSF